MEHVDQAADGSFGSLRLPKGAGTALETTIKAEMFQNEIIEDMKAKFGIHVHSVSPIDWRHGNRDELEEIIETA